MFFFFVCVKYVLVYGVFISTTEPLNIMDKQQHFDSFLGSYVNNCQLGSIAAIKNT